MSDLISSGIPREVHKFSKFIHGCAVLLPEEVQAMPYWIDDPSLRDSIIASGSEEVSKFIIYNYYSKMLERWHFGHDAC